MGVRYLNTSRKRLGDYLVDLGFITEEQLNEALKEQKEKGGKLGAILIQLGHLTEDILLAVLGKQTGVSYVSLTEYGDIPEDAIKMVPETIAKNQMLIPIKKEGNLLTIAIADPLNVFATDDLKLLTGCDIRMVVASDNDIKTALDKYYTKKKKKRVSTDSELKDAVNQITQMDLSTLDSSAQVEFIKDSIFDVEEEGESAPAIKLTNMILSEAVAKGASDIHIEPQDKKLVVRFRIDGVLHEQPSPPKRAAASLTSRLKVMADIDISERRIPQDGRTKIHMEGRDLDIRVSTIPTVFGEKIVLRLLDPEGLTLDMTQLGFDEKELTLFKKHIEAPYGMILVTGPTGSGKTTTLYSALAALNQPHVNIVTIEEPVEYILPGINQVQAKPDIGLTFAAGLRAFLRQDPDIVMLGEIRDKETAEIAGNAALTGHLVLTTVHTNDAASTVIRLLNMGVEPVLISATLRLIVAQRLLRKVCSQCRVPYEVTVEELSGLGVTLQLSSSTKIRLFKGKGCEMCHNSGYKGRVGIYEVLEVNEEMRQLVVKQAPPYEIRAAASRTGLETLREAAVKKLFAGITSLEEVIRVTLSDSEVSSQ
ncbi:MAG: Flp pilus assembly complex ATPase component TadA [Elusimicrobia bacterium]|nr:Flp pilus assembly complex ATPase component TadA [Candidatus Obscuribacterium magneticum]